MIVERNLEWPVRPRAGGDENDLAPQMNCFLPGPVYCDGVGTFKPGHSTVKGDAMGGEILENFVAFVFDYNVLPVHQVTHGEIFAE